MSMQLPVWLSQRHVAPLAIVRGGSGDALLELLRSDTTAQLTVVCDRDLSERMAFAATVERWSRPTVVVTRGLVADIEQFIAQKHDRRGLLMAVVLETYLREEHQRLTERAATMAGYPASPAVVEQVVVTRAFRVLRELAERLVSPLVVHDAAYGLPRVAGTGLAVFEYPGAPDSRAGGRAVETAPPRGSVEDHARFLAENDPGVLLEMHLPFGGPECGVLFEWWSAQIADLGRDVALAPMVAEARQALASIQEQLPRRLVKPVRRPRV